MDLLSLVTSGVNDNEVCGPDEDILGVVEGWQDDETHNPDVPAVSHKRGLTPFVFVPFEEVHVFLLFHSTFCNQIPLWPRRVFINPLLKAKKCSHHMLSFCCEMFGVCFCCDVGRDIVSESAGGEDGLFRTWLIPQR